MLSKLSYGLMPTRAASSDAPTTDLRKDIHAGVRCKGAPPCFSTNSRICFSFLLLIFSKLLHFFNIKNNSMSKKNTHIDKGAFCGTHRRGLRAGGCHRTPATEPPLSMCVNFASHAFFPLKIIRIHTSCEFWLCFFFVLPLFKPQHPCN